MFLGDVIGQPVLADGQRVGYLSDVRLFVPDHTAGQQVGTPEVYGVVICPRRTGSFLGFERRGVRASRECRVEQCRVGQPVGPAERGQRRPYGQLEIAP